MDQFEEVFSLRGEAGHADAFVAALLARSGVVVLVLRADFYGHPPPRTPSG